MQFSKEDLSKAAQQTGIAPETVNALWDQLQKGSSQKKSEVGFSNLIYYLGACIVIAAMAWFFYQQWQTYNGLEIIGLAIVYAICFVIAGRILWYKQGLQVPGGLFFTLAICMVPLAVYGLQLHLGFWKFLPDIPDYLTNNQNQLVMEFSTVLASLVAMRFINFSFLAAPMCVALWLMSFDLATFFFSSQERTWEHNLWVSLGVGAAMIIVSYLADNRTKVDYSFWGYLFGLMAFWWGLTMLIEKNESQRLLFAFINLGLMLIAVVLDRRVFVVFGTLGLLIYFGHLAFTIFKDSFWFPIVLSLFGILLIYLGICYQKNEGKIRNALLRFIPERFQNAVIPSKRRKL